MSLDFSKDSNFAPVVGDEARIARKPDPSFGRLWSLDGSAVLGATIAVVLCSSIGVLLYLA
jgi:hypothetical protein